MPKSSRKGYWQDRVREQEEKSYSRLIRETEKELREIYAEQGEELRKSILDVLAKIEATKQSGEPLQANDLYRDRRYWLLLDEINERLKRLGAIQIEVTEPAIARAYEETIEAIDSNVVAKAADVNVALMNAHAIDAAQVVNQVWCLDGKRFSDRVWSDKSKLLARLKRALADSLVQGKPSWEIAKRMADELGVSRENAYRLVRTETAHAQNYAQTKRYKEYGFTEGEFLASPECCGECQGHDGERFSLDELETLIPVHPNCRCTYRLVGD